jgi:malonate-semialdehyde dehydrogenase (acetylating)/methylmalonate-semialdehyde dehydrogenase
MHHQEVLNYIDGSWIRSDSGESIGIDNPANGEKLGTVTLSNQADVDCAVKAARSAFGDWRRTPPTDRIQYLFQLKTLLEENLDDIARVTTLECGKTWEEAKGELRRGIQNVEVACGIPLLMMGSNAEDISSGIDEHMIRQPLGVVTAITPFNFPAMIPLWFLPYAIACGNTFILKPSERVPLTMASIFELVDRLGLPPGVASLVQGRKRVVDALIEHPDVRAVSFVGSTPVARSIYAKAASYGKRVQAQGGAKNAVVILPDADMKATSRIVNESAFGCAGQRCLAASAAITVGNARDGFGAEIRELAESCRLGFGLNTDVTMGPVITSESKNRIAGLIEQGLEEGAEAVVDGRKAVVRGAKAGNFLGPTILSGVSPSSQLARTEIFGPVLSTIHVDDLDQAINLINQSDFGNMACLFTSSGRSAREFRYRVRAGNIGINVGVAAPMAFFPFSGWKDSFFGDLHAQGLDAIEFYTEKKIVVERWPS